MFRCICSYYKCLIFPVENLFARACYYEVAELSEENCIQHVLNRWENVFPGVQNYVEDGTSLSWALEEWSGGGALPTAEQNAALSTHVGKAEERIHFAGEHASEYHGWMQGALVSGLRAATEIHEGD